MWLLTLKSILVATDLTESSMPALLTAARLAPLAEARLHLLHVTEEAVPSAPVTLKEFFHRTVGDGPEPDSMEVVAGSPAETIVEHAAGRAADTVILGRHRGGGKTGAMGSTAASVVRAAPCPCLVAATELHLPLRSVLVPIDLSETASGALSVALSWASALRPRAGRAVLTALHVASDPADASAEQAVRARIEEARGRAGGAAHVDMDWRIVHDHDPTAAILREAEAEGTDLLVMGMHGAGGPAEALGSIAAAVSRATPSPLLLVPQATWAEPKN